MNICSRPPAELEAGRLGCANRRGRTAMSGVGALDFVAAAGRFTSRAFFEAGELGRWIGWRPALAGALGAGSGDGALALTA